MRTRTTRASTALLTSLALALPLTAATAQAASTTAASTVSYQRAAAVTLPTGDHVTTVGTGEKAKALVQPAAASGPGRVLVTRRMNSHLYVMPADAEPYLGRFLDVGLFDISRLQAGLKSSGQLPVRISYSGSTPNVPGVTITSAQAGVAKGYLTTTSAPDFGRALSAQWEADSKANWPKRSTLFPGVTKVVSDLPAQPTVTALFPMYTLVIKTIGPDGKPQPNGFVALLNVDDGAKYNGYASAVDGEARVSVPKGNYSLVGDDLQFDDVADTATYRVTTVNEFTVTGSGQTVTIDHRKATEHPSVSTPKPASPTSYGLEWDRFDATGAGALGTGYTVDASTDLLVAPNGPAKIGTISVSQAWQLSAAGDDPAYTYDLATVANRIPASLHSTFTSAQLGTLQASYYGDGKPTVGGTLRIPIFPTSLGGFGIYQRVPRPASRTEYIGATGAAATWIEGTLANNDSPDDPGFLDAPERVIPAGASQKVDWFRAPLGAGIPKQSGQYGYCWACRSDKQLAVSLAPFVDSDPTHSGEIFGALDGLPVARFRFYTNGKLVSDQDDALGGLFAVDTKKASYSAVLDVDRRLQQPNQSTKSQTELTFTSADGTGSPAPKDWFCDLTAACSVLPIVQAKLALPTRLDGTLPNGTSAVTVTVARLQNAPASAAKTAGLEIRPAGELWSTIKLKAIGGGKFTGTIDNSGLAGLDVDVRVSGADEAGSTYRQTVLRAYTVAAS